MRRWSRVTMLGVLVVALLSACAPPAGTDGDLTDDWAGFAQPELFAPHAGVCHAVREKTGYLTGYLPIDCARIHKTETFHIGTFAGALAERPSPPAPDSPVLGPAFTDCDKRAERFVGANWRSGRLSVQVVPPSPANWTAGGRWYRCELFVLDILDAGAGVGGNARDLVIEWQGSLRDALKQPSSLRYDCFNEDNRHHLRPVACTSTHRFEFAGVWTAPFTSYDELRRDYLRLHRQCRSVIADFTGTGSHGMGTTIRPPSEEAWERGDRGIRCFLWSDRKAQTRSLRGTGRR